MSRVENRTVRQAPAPIVREIGGSAADPEAETNYVTPPLGRIRVASVTVRRVNRIAPRSYRIDERD